VYAPRNVVVPRASTVIFVSVSLVSACSTGGAGAPGSGAAHSGATTSHPGPHATALPSIDTSATAPSASHVEDGSPPAGPVSSNDAASCVALPRVGVPSALASGVAMNNATPAPSSGPVDRLGLTAQVVASHRDRLACCGVHRAGPPTPDAGFATLRFELAAGGDLQSFTLVDVEGGLIDGSVESCMRDVAQSIAFPPSPKGRATIYLHRLDLNPAD